MPRHFVQAMLVAFAIVPSAAAGQSLNVVANPIPQGYVNTCQSYALSFALARANVPGFTLATVGDVRAGEQNVRQAIEAEVKAGETPYSHAVWQRAVARLTSNNYKLNRVEYSSYESFVGEIVAKTGISNAETLGESVSFLLSQTPVMTSFNSIGGNNYATGHIVTIFGAQQVTGPANAASKLLLLNSAVKGAGAGAPVYAPLCPTNSLPGDLRYTGALRLEADYALKAYGGKFVLFWISRS